MIQPFGSLGSLASWAMLQQRQVVEYVTLPSEEPERGILTLIVESFALAGTLLLGTVLIGLGVGIFRVWLLRLQRKRTGHPPARSELRPASPPGLGDRFPEQVPVVIYDGG